MVTNVAKFEVTGNKMNQKVYIHHTGYPGGLRKTPIKEMLKKHPEEPLRHAVYGMLPRDKFRLPRMARLKMFVGDDHPYEANILRIYPQTQNPQILSSNK